MMRITTNPTDPPTIPPISAADRPFDEGPPSTSSVVGTSVVGCGSIAI